MSKIIKEMEERAKNATLTRRIIKQLLYALHVSEGFGEQRLMRVLYEWTEVYKFVNDPKNDLNSEMLLIDKLLDSVLPERVMSSVGYEKLLDKKGKEVT